MTKQASGRAAAAETELEMLRARAGVLQASDAEAQRRLFAMEAESADKARTMSLASVLHCSHHQYYMKVQAFAAQR